MGVTEVVSVVLCLLVELSTVLVDNVNCLGILLCLCTTFTVECGGSRHHSKKRLKNKNLRDKKSLKNNNKNKRKKIKLRS